MARRTRNHRSHKRSATHHRKRSGKGRKGSRTRRHRRGGSTSMQLFGK